MSGLHPSASDLVDSRHSGGGSPNHLFIMAASHSGSTLLTYLIAAHPGAATIGESSGILPSLNVDEYPCSCGTPIRQCEFWREVARRMSERGVPFDVGDFGTRFLMPSRRFLGRVLRAEHRGPLLEALRDVILWLSPAWRSHRSGIRTSNQTLAEVVREIQNAGVLVDSSKHPHRLRFLMDIRSLNIKVIHLVRDGRGVALTYIEQEGWSMERAAMEWRRNVTAAENCLASLPDDQVVQVRYEDYCASVEPTLKMIFSFVGLDPEAKRPNFRSAGNHVVGNGMRLEATKDVCLDERWKSVLSQGQLAEFARVSGELNRQYGYE